MQQLLAKFTAFLGSRGFYYGVLIFFAVEALWVACSALYPMAFDEEFHYGLVRFYTHYVLPFVGQQPPEADVFGAVARDPSYLYHFLASFPDRFLGMFTDNQTAHVLFLRFINIGLVAWALVLFGKLLVQAGMSRAFTHTALALFVIIPITPILAGQVGYDPLCMVLVAWACLLVFRLTRQLQARELEARTIVTLVVVVLLASLVKYAFLPIMVACLAFGLYQFWRAFKGQRLLLRTAYKRCIRPLTRRTKIWMVVLLVVAAGLFVQRYGVNLVRFHSPLANCETTLSVERCKNYSPWARNYRMHHEPVAVGGSPVMFTGHWLVAMHYRLFFSINGPQSDYVNYRPLPVLSAASLALTCTSLVALALFGWRALRGNRYLAFLLVAVGLYCVALWINNYTDYLATGVPIAINGRYLLLVLLPIAALFGAALRVGLRRWPNAKPVLAGLALLLFLQGGGVLSFIVRSDPTWLWPNSTVVQINEAARHVVAPLVIENNKRY